MRESFRKGELTYASKHRQPSSYTKQLRENCRGRSNASRGASAKQESVGTRALIHASDNK
jgi:hypothetical protein